MISKFIQTGLNSLFSAGLVLTAGSCSAQFADTAHETIGDVPCPAGGSSSMPDPESSRVDRFAIRKLMADWSAAVMRADFETLGSLVTEDAEFWTHGAAPLNGRGALIAAFEPFLEEFVMQQNYQCSELIISGDWAFLRGLEVNHLTPRSSGETIVRRQREFSVLKRQASGKWLFARGMTNLPPDR